MQVPPPFMGQNLERSRFSRTIARVMINSRRRNKLPRKSQLPPIFPQHAQQDLSSLDIRQISHKNIYYKDYLREACLKRPKARFDSPSPDAAATKLPCNSPVNSGQTVAHSPSKPVALYQALNAQIRSNNMRS